MGNVVFWQKVLSQLGFLHVPVGCRLWGRTESDTTEAT